MMRAPGQLENDDPMTADSSEAVAGTLQKRPRPPMDRPDARMFGGVTRLRVATIAWLCAVLALSNSVQEVLIAWQGRSMIDWLVWPLGFQFANMTVIAVAMAIPLVIVGNLGPQAGWLRIAALALTVALAAVPAGALRMGFLIATGGYRLADFTAFSGLMWWARYAQLAGLFTVLVEFQRREKHSIESMHQAEIDRLALDREMDQARLQVLQAQIEPHFLFNTLANVRRLYQTDSATGRNMLENLMRYLEVALPHMRESRSTLARELALAEAYLNVQHIRMGRRLRFQIDVPQALREFELPPMMLLTLVENAIKHGLNPLPEGGFIRIAGRIDAGRLRIDVADSGRGFQASSGGGTGLSNIRARLTAMHGDAAALLLAENMPRGITSTLVLPLVRQPIP